MVHRYAPPLLRLLDRREFRDCPDPTLKGQCWLYTLFKDKDGYGRIEWNNKKWYCHRLAYFLIKGPLTEGLEIDHLCAVRACFNPDHLEETLHQINTARGNAGKLEREKTHCKHGHEYSEENTRWKFRKGKLQQRECKACEKVRSNKRKQKDL